MSKLPIAFVVMVSGRKGRPAGEREKDKMFYPYYYRTYKLEHGLVSPEEQRAADYRVGETAAVLAGIRKSLACTVSHGTDVVGLQEDEAGGEGRHSRPGGCAGLESARSARIGTGLLRAGRRLSRPPLDACAFKARIIRTSYAGMRPTSTRPQSAPIRRVRPRPGAAVLGRGRSPYSPRRAESMAVPAATIAGPTDSTLASTTRATRPRPTPPTGPR